MFLRCDAKCCGGAFYVRHLAFASLVGVFLTLLGALGVYITLYGQFMRSARCLAVELGALNEHGARVASLSPFGHPYSPALWAVRKAEDPERLQDEQRRASCFEWGMFSESVWPTADALELLRYLPLLVIACPVVAALFSLASACCGLRRDVKSFCLMKTLCAVPHVYPFLLLLSLGIFLFLSVAPLAWEAGAAPGWLSLDEATATAQWNCEPHGAAYSMPLDARSPLEHYGLAHPSNGGAPSAALSTATRLRRWAATVEATNASGSAPEAYAGAAALPANWQRACHCFFSMDPDEASGGDGGGGGSGGGYRAERAFLRLHGLAPSAILGAVGVALLYCATAAMCCAAGCCCDNPSASFEVRLPLHDPPYKPPASPMKKQPAAAAELVGGALSPGMVQPRQSV